MRLFHAVVAAVASLTLTFAAAAFERGPAVGANVAAHVAAPDQTGAARTFDTLKGRNGLVLVFNRSADWCPICQRQMIDLDGVRPLIEAEGYRLAILTTDTPDKQLRFATQRRMGFTFLSDPQSVVVDRFGLRDPAFPAGHRIHGVPVPAVFVLNAQGVVQAKLGDDNYRVRPASAVVVETVRAVNR